jgi:CBS-domain-containing membrane protein
MTLANTVYPPGGAIALLAGIDKTVVEMSWTLVPCVLLGSIIMTAVALVVNNIQRKFPNWWWSERETGQLYQRWSHDKTAAEAEGASVPKREKKWLRDRGAEDTNRGGDALDTVDEDDVMRVLNWLEMQRSRDDVEDLAAGGSRMDESARKESAALPSA